MASGSHSLLNQEEFLCSICLDVFRNPVSTPCGHNFCSNCITTYWDSGEDAPCLCPICKTAFYRRPDLKVNTFISSLVDQLMSQQLADTCLSVPETQPATFGGAVFCDVCDETKRGAVKTCLECLTSFCDLHLEPHKKAGGLRRHTLVEPQWNLEDRICKEHNKIMQMFCRTDGRLLCELCIKSRRLTHNVVSLQQAYAERKSLLDKKVDDVQQMSKLLQEEMAQLKERTERSEHESRDLELGVMDELSTLVSKMQTYGDQLALVMEDSRRAAREECERLVKDQEEDIEDLRLSESKFRELGDERDHLSLLSVPLSEFTLPTIHGMERSRRFSGVRHPGATLTRRLSLLRDTMSQMEAELGNWSNEAVQPALREAQLLATDVNLDADTAHPMLVLSPDRKSVSYSGVVQRLTNSPLVFTEHLAVLGDKGFSSSFYFQVNVGQKREWTLGVATASICRRGVKRSPGCGLWAIWFIIDRFESFDRPDEAVHVGTAETVGVLVDYKDGEVTFYDSETADVIHTISGCDFQEAVYPYFNPCDNEYGSNLEPMTIVPVGRNF